LWHNNCLELNQISEKYIRLLDLRSNYTLTCNASKTKTQNYRIAKLCFFRVLFHLSSYISFSLQSWNFAKTFLSIKTSLRGSLCETMLEKGRKERKKDRSNVLTMWKGKKNDLEVCPIRNDTFFKYSKVSGLKWSEKYFKKVDTKSTYSRNFDLKTS